MCSVYVYYYIMRTEREKNYLTAFFSSRHLCFVITFDLLPFLLRHHNNNTLVHMNYFYNRAHRTVLYPIIATIEGGLIIIINIIFEHF